MKILKAGTFLYRCRPRDPLERIIPYVAQELGAPPEGRPRHGRFNPTGVPVLYLAGSPLTALKETRLDNGVVAEAGKFIVLRDLPTWDVRETDIKDFVSLPTMNPGIINKEYLFPNFLAQCASKAGIYGIQYGSVQDNDGWNIALFHC
jgi:hypothetical protein